MSEEINNRLESIEVMLKLILKREINGGIDMIDVNEAAKICKLSVGSIYNYVSCGRLNIPIRKRGNKLEFNREDVIRWNEERTSFRRPSH